MRQGWFTWLEGNSCKLALQENRMNITGLIPVPYPCRHRLQQLQQLSRWDLGMLRPLFIVRSLLKSVEYQCIRVFRPGKQLTLLFWGAFWGGLQGLFLEGYFVQKFCPKQMYSLWLLFYWRAQCYEPIKNVFQFLVGGPDSTFRETHTQHGYEPILKRVASIFFFYLYTKFFKQKSINPHRP